MNLSKALHSVNHDLLIANLYAYDFCSDSIKLLYSYLCNRQYRNKINQNIISWKELSQGVPQGTALGSLLFNIYLKIYSFYLSLLMSVILQMRQTFMLVIWT